MPFYNRLEEWRSNLYKKKDLILHFIFYPSKDDSLLRLTRLLYGIINRISYRCVLIKIAYIPPITYEFQVSEFSSPKEGRVRMLWEIYFWIILIIVICSMFVEMVHGSVIEITDMIISVFSILGLFCYGYKKQLLSKLFWKFVFIITVIEGFAYIMLVVLNDPKLGLGEMIFVTAFTLSIMYPFFLGLYRYGIRKQHVNLT